MMKFLDELFFNLMKEISPDRRVKPYITEKDFEKIVANGVNWLVDKGFNKNNLRNIEMNGDVFNYYNINPKEFIKKIPLVSRKLALVSMGVMGLGNHFIEMQRCDKIINKNIAEKFGINKNNVVFMIHSSPDAFGKSMHDHFSFRSNKVQKFSQIYRKIYDRLSISNNDITRKTVFGINYYANKIYRYLNWKLGIINKYQGQSYKTIPIDSSFGRNFINASYAELNFGFTNRMMQYSLIEKVLNKSFQNVKLSLLYDGNHDAFQKEYLDGEAYWMHRNGSGRAYPKHMMKGHKIYSKTGQPITMPGSMGHASYLCAATRGNRKAFYSASHGAGRILDKPETLGRFNQSDVIKEMKNKKIRLYRFGQGNIVEEAPSSYKDISEVVNVLKQNKIADPVVKLKPIAVLKGN